MVQHLTESVKDQLSKKLNSSIVCEELPVDVIEELENELQPLEVEQSDDIQKLEKRVEIATGALEKVMSEALRYRIEDRVRGRDFKKPVIEVSGLEEQ